MRKLHGAHHKMLACGCVLSALQSANKWVAGLQKTIEQRPPTVIDKLRIIYKSREITPRPIAAHSRVPATVRESVRLAYLALGQISEDHSLLNPAPITTIEPEHIDDYRPLARCGLGNFYVAA